MSSNSGCDIPIENYKMNIESTPEKSNKKFYNPSTEDKTDNLSAIPKPNFSPLEKLGSSLSFKKRGIYKERKRSEIPPSSSKFFQKCGTGSLKFKAKRLSFGTEKNTQMNDEESKTSNDRSPVRDGNFWGSRGVFRKLNFDEAIKENPEYRGLADPQYLGPSREKQVEKVLFLDGKEEEEEDYEKSKNEKYPPIVNLFGKKGQNNNNNNSSNNLFTSSLLNFNKERGNANTAKKENIFKITKNYDNRAKFNSIDSFNTFNKNNNIFNNDNKPFNFNPLFNPCKSNDDSVISPDKNNNTNSRKMDDFNIISTVASGNFGVVYLCSLKEKKNIMDISEDEDEDTNNTTKKFITNHNYNNDINNNNNNNKVYDNNNENKFAIKKSKNPVSENEFKLLKELSEKMKSTEKSGQKYINIKAQTNNNNNSESNTNIDLVLSLCKKYVNVIHDVWVEEDSESDDTDEEMDGEDNYSRRKRSYKSSNRGGKLFISSKYCEYGDLFDFLGRLERADFKFTKAFYWNIIFEMLCGIRYLHNIGYVHLDIKPENFLVDKNGKVCLADFGLSQKASEISSYDVNEGDITYIAPEIVSNQGLIDSSSDLFSFGLSVLEVLSKVNLPTEGEVWRLFRSESFEISQLPKEFFINWNLPEEDMPSYNELLGLLLCSRGKRGGFEEIMNISEIKERWEKLKNGEYEGNRNVGEWIRNSEEIKRKGVRKNYTGIEEDGDYMGNNRKEENTNKCINHFCINNNNNNNIEYNNKNNYCFNVFNIKKDSIFDSPKK